MPRDTIQVALKTITDTKSVDLTEDTYFALNNGRQLTLMIGDGAPQRLKTTTSLTPMLSAYGEGTAPGRYAALLARDTVAELTVTAPDTPVAEMALEANRRLNANLKQVYGELRVEAVLAQEPALTALHEDPRFLRWVLPVSCITIARLDLLTGRLEYAHGADTALIAFYKDARTVQVTPDQMGQHDDKMRREMGRIMAEVGLNTQPTLDALRPHFEPAFKANRYNGIFHNYVDEQGNTDPTVGVGVINGLPELEAYLVTGTLDASELDAVLLCSDGFLWPSVLDETPAQMDERLDFMRRTIAERGLDGYLKLLREEEISDMDGAKYLRFGNHDDSTAILATFSVVSA